MIKTGSVLFLILIWSLSLFAASVQVEIRPPQSPVYEGEPFFLTLSVVSDGEVSAQDPRLPDLDGFQLLDVSVSSSSSHRMTYENNKPSFKSENRQDFNYKLLPKKAGRFLIGSFDIVVDGASYKTQPVNLTVVSGSGRSRSQGPQNAFPDEEDMDPSEDIFQQLIKQREQLLKQLGSGGGVFCLPVLVKTLRRRLKEN